MAEKTMEKRRKKPEEKSYFSLTCTRLSQYIQRNGSYADRSPRMSPWPLHLEDKEKDKDQTSAPNTKYSKLLDEKKRAGKEKRQLTIFYGGKVVVFDNFPEDSAADLMSMASGAMLDGDLKNDSMVEPPVSGHEPPTVLRLQNKPNHQACSSDMPIARRNSLNRFLEKRKDRVALPPTSSEQPKAEAKADETQAWLSLGPQALIPGRNFHI